MFNYLSNKLSIQLNQTEHHSNTNCLGTQRDYILEDFTRNDDVHIDTVGSTNFNKVENDKVYDFLTEFHTKVKVFVPVQIFIIQTLELLLENYIKEKEESESSSNFNSKGAKSWLIETVVPILGKFWLLKL